MPCDQVVERKLKRNVNLPSEREMRQAFGATDHKDLHRILENIDDKELEEKLRKLVEKKKRKRKTATERYLAQYNR